MLATFTGARTTVINGSEAASIALLGNYMAASFVTAGDGQGGAQVTQAPESEQPLVTTHPAR